MSKGQKTETYFTLKNQPTVTEKCIKQNWGIKKPQKKNCIKIEINYEGNLIKQNAEIFNQKNNIK